MDYGGRARPRAGAAGPPRQAGAGGGRKRRSVRRLTSEGPAGRAGAGEGGKASCRGYLNAAERVRLNLHPCGQAGGSTQRPATCCSPGRAGSEAGPGPGPRPGREGAPERRDQRPASAEAHPSSPPPSVAVPSLWRLLLGLGLSSGGFAFPIKVTYPISFWKNILFYLSQGVSLFPDGVITSFRAGICVPKWVLFLRASDLLVRQEALFPRVAIQ